MHDIVEIKKNAICQGGHEKCLMQKERKKGGKIYLLLWWWEGSDFDKYNE